MKLRITIVAVLLLGFGALLSTPPAAQSASTGPSHSTVQPTSKESHPASSSQTAAKDAASKSSKSTSQNTAADSASPAGKSAKADYSDQAEVLEDLKTTITYHDDGTSITTRSARIKIQSQAGVQGFGMLQFPYASATTKMQIVYVRVIKPDKTVVVTPAANVMDMPARITQQAPLYSDIKVLQVAVKGLETGDTLEFKWRADKTKPLDPGQFWNKFNFMRKAIVLHEELQVTIPTDRKVIVKSATVQPTIQTEGANRVYTWETKNLKVKTDKSSDSDSKLPDVQLTSLQSWNALGKWFGGLADPRAVPTPEIKAKANELTRGAKTEKEKIQDLYAFVSTKFRYIGIDLGIGRYQPHPAAEVLSNDYGDCKDKHTLLAALLAAEGIRAYPALINSSAKIDRDVPSPAQFDHVITAIPQGKGFLFLDTTPEVGPFGYLVPNLRDKWALVIPDTGEARLVKTPADAPYPEYFHVRAEATLDDSGTLNSKIQMTFRDDSELVFRLAFRQAGQPQWNEVMQKISQNMGYGGTVSNVTVTPPDQTQTPFQISYDYKRKNYGDWADKKIVPPFPPIFITPVPDHAAAKTKPIKLGTPEESDYVASIALPRDLTPTLPAAVHLSTPFGTYDATYAYAFRVSGGVLRVERKLVTKVREIPPAKMDAYGKFEKSIENDEQTFIPLVGAESENGTSGSPEAVKLYNEGRQAAQMRDLPGAIEYLQQAVRKDPKYAQAWMALGWLHAAMGSRDQATGELKKAIALAPKQAYAYELLGTLLIQERRPEDALAVWQKLEKASPTNVIAPIRVGSILLSLKRYPEALTELEAAVNRNPANATLQSQLGVAYARTGSTNKAMASFESALRIDPSANNLNTVAYEMAQANVQLPKALEYAQKAVSKEEAATAKIDIDTATPVDFATATRLAAYWDTLGWVYFRTGDLEKAEKYLKAAWHLSQDPTGADHLGQLYEKEGKKLEARRAYEDAVATQHAPQHAVDRLDAIGGGGGFDVMPQAIQNLRIVRLAISPKPKHEADADFVVSLSPGKVQAEFVSGSPELRDDAKTLETAKFDFPFPDEGPVKILRRGLLDCEPEMKECSYAMYPLAYPKAATATEAKTPTVRPGEKQIIVTLTPHAGPTDLSDASKNAASSKPSESTKSPAKH